MPGCNCPPYNCDEQRLKALNGHQAAATELMQKFTPLVRVVVRRELGPDLKSEWEDAQQQAMMRIFQGMGNWQGRAPFCKWVAIVAANGARDLRNSAYRHRTRQSPLDDSEIVAPPADIYELEMQECIEKIIAKLPATWKHAYHLKFQGKDHKQIAASMGKKPRAILYWLAAIRERLRPCFETK